MKVTGISARFVPRYAIAAVPLLWIVPLTIFLIAMLLYMNTKSAVKTAIVMLAVPFSLVGAIWLLWLLGYPDQARQRSAASVARARELRPELVCEVRIESRDGEPIARVAIGPQDDRADLRFVYPQPQQRIVELAHEDSLHPLRRARHPASGDRRCGGALAVRCTPPGRIGTLEHTCGAVIRHPRRFRSKALIHQFELVGVSSLGIIDLLALLPASMALIASMDPVLGEVDR